MKRLTLLILIAFSGCAFHHNPKALITRETRAQSYLDTHVSIDLKNSPNIHQALQNVFLKLPDDVFNEVTDHKRPVIFLGSYTTTIARYARSHQFLVTPTDHKDTLNDGVYIIILADELNSSSVEAIEGIIYHELAHRYLEHLLKSSLNCDVEREANRLVKQWGFEKEFSAASNELGAKLPGDSPCRDEEYLRN